MSRLFALHKLEALIGGIAEIYLLKQANTIPHGQKPLWETSSWSHGLFNALLEWGAAFMTTSCFPLRSSSSMSQRRRPAREPGRRRWPAPRRGEPEARVQERGGGGGGGSFAAFTVKDTNWIPEPLCIETSKNCMNQTNNNKQMTRAAQDRVKPTQHHNIFNLILILNFFLICATPHT